MSDFPTYDDLFEIGLTAMLATPGGRITEDAARREGSDANLLLSACASMGEEIVRQLVRVAGGLVLDTARGQSLRRLAMDLPFVVDPKPAAAAYVTVTFTRPTAAAGEGTIDAGTRFTLGGVAFQTLQAIQVESGALSASGDAQATVAGPEGNVSAGSSGKLLGSLWDTSLVPSTASGGAGGSVAESDDDFKARIRVAPIAARRGTKGALEFAALSVPGVSNAVAYEILNADGSLSGVTELCFSDSQGKGNDTLKAAVRAELTEYAAHGGPVSLLYGVPDYVAIRLGLSFVSGYDTEAVWAEVVLRVVAAVNRLSPGETLYPSTIVAAARPVAGVADVTVDAPVGPVVPATSSVVLRTSAPMVTRS